MSSFIPRISGTIILVAATVATAAPAAAPTAAGAADGAASTVDIQVVGEVQARCGFASGFAPQSPATFQATGGALAPVRIAFRLDCNDEFSIQVTSENGALRSQADESALARAQANGFRVEAPYRVNLSVARDDAPALVEECSSEQLRTGAGCAMASGAGQVSEFTSMAGESALTIEFPEAVSPGDYVAGRYRDVLTITVGTRS